MPLKEPMEVFYQKNWKRVYACCRAYLAHHQNAEDLTSEVFLTVLQKYPELENPEHYLN
jgi:DNA-directed RNA polymerase specialized sigma24 family protein